MQRYKKGKHSGKFLYNIFYSFSKKHFTLCCFALFFTYILRK
uniref:Uncharacterized protein n=1 Tax=Siphoviridae sp. ctqv63 TaxID=2827950 RepID=A0A8S5SSS7_9CAUD|nr:MAG TPA: hypothetical protein [Siphoviridae sp. ctqv63]